MNPMNPMQFYATADRGVFNQLRRALQKQNRARSEKMEEIAIPEETEIRNNPPIKAWASRHFLAQLFVDKGNLRLSICRTEIQNDGNWKDGITWDELQRVKTACGYGDDWAVEIYPPDANVINVANIRHLWILPTAPEYGWKGGES